MIFPLKANGSVKTAVEGMLLTGRIPHAIISEGDVAGCVISLSESDEDGVIDRDVEKKLIVTAASFLGKQLES